PLGMRNKRIHNNQITASSQYDKNHAPYLARLFAKRRGRFMGAWSAKVNNRHQWLQIDLGRTMRLEGIATQGREDANQWVRQFWLYYSMDKVYFSEVRQWFDNKKVFNGNYDRFVVVINKFRRPLNGRYFRVHPVTWRRRISMRVEFYGCVTGI
ncbi:predicted protein, partial [Nematostella vectensis]